MAPDTRHDLERSAFRRPEPCGYGPRLTTEPVMGKTCNLTRGQ
jgi:hypothetical protein